MIRRPPRSPLFPSTPLFRSLSRELNVRFIRAVVRGLDGSEVVTDRGRFRGRVLVDASGWRAVLASALARGFVDRRAMSFGIGTEPECTETRLHFWLDPTVVPHGMGWLFPAGATARVGLASHGGETNLVPVLNR